MNIKKTQHNNLPILQTPIDEDDYQAQRILETDVIKRILLVTKRQRKFSVMYEMKSVFVCGPQI